jgi:hypothetical protein
LEVPSPWAGRLPASRIPAGLPLGNNAACGRGYSLVVTRDRPPSGVPRLSGHGEHYGYPRAPSNRGARASRLPCHPRTPSPSMTSYFTHYVRRVTVG